MLKYIFLIISGIILFILYNRIDNFSIGIPEYIYRLYPNTFVLTGIKEEGILVNPSQNVYRNIDTPGLYSVYADNDVQANDIFIQYLQSDIFREYTRRGNTCSAIIEDMPTEQLMPTKAVLESRFHYTFNDAIVTQGDFRLYDITRQFMAQSEIKLKSIYRNSGNSRTHYALSNDSPNQKLFYLTRRLTNNDYVQIHSDKSRQKGLTFNHYYNVNGDNVNEFIVARVLIEKMLSGGMSDYQLYLTEFTTVPQGFGYGNKIMELLSLLRYNEIMSSGTNEFYKKQIQRFIPYGGSEKSYRNQFRLSVKSESEGGWAKIPGEKFSIYKPLVYTKNEMPVSTMTTLYFTYETMNDYEKLYFLLNPSDEETIVIENLLKYNHFLMQLTEDEDEYEEVDELHYLSDIDENFTIIDDLYRSFLSSNYE